MTYSDDIYSTQQFVNAAESFVKALGALFPVQRFDEFFHRSTLIRGYWTALEKALNRYRDPARVLLVKSLMKGHVFADPRVIDELLKLFLPGQTPDFRRVAEVWSTALDHGAPDPATLVLEAETLFMLLADELRQSPDLRLALQQLSQVRTDKLSPWKDDAATAEQDLNRLLDAALIAGPSTLGLQVRHLMALTSDRAPLPAAEALDQALYALARLAERLPEDVLRGVWNRRDQIGDPHMRARVIGRIAPYLSRIGIARDPLALVRDALSAGGSDVDPALRVDVLLQLAPHLDAPDRGALPSFQERILAGMQAIGDPPSRVRALGALIPYLPVHLQTNAVSLAFRAAQEGIASEVSRAEALSVLAPHLPVEFQERLMGIAFGLALPEARAQLLGRLLPHLPATLQVQALTGTLSAVEAIAGDEARRQALVALAPQIEAVGPLLYLPDVLRQAIEITFSIDAPGERARAFAALAPYLSPELLREALHATRDIADDDNRATTLARLAQHLPSDLQVAAFGIAQELHPAQARATALVAIAPYLSLTARQQALADALAAALAIERRFDRVVALADLAPHLRDDLQARALSEALTATRAIPDESERGRALIFLAPHLLDVHLQDALNDAYTILDPLERAPALSALMRRLPDRVLLRVAQDVIESARAVKPPHYKAGILAACASVLPDTFVPDVLEIVDSIDTPYDRMHVLAALLPRDPERLRALAFVAARAVPNRYQRIHALLELIPHTAFNERYPLLDETLEIALGIRDDYDRASALAHLAPYMDSQADVQNRQQDALHLALLACMRVEDPVTRSDLLARLAAVWSTLLTSAQSYTLWRDVTLFLRARAQVEVMGDLAALAPVIARIGSPQAADAVVEKLAAALKPPDAERDRITG